MAALEPPDDRWYKRVLNYMKGMKPSLVGEDAIRYELEQPDMIVIKPSKIKDPISRFIVKYLLKGFHRSLGRKRRNPSLNHWITYSESTILAVANFCIVFLTSTLLAGATSALGFIESMWNRLIAIVAFCMVFAAFLSLFEADPVPSIAATAALVIPEF